LFLSLLLGFYYLDWTFRLSNRWQSKVDGLQAGWRIILASLKPFYSQFGEESGPPQS
jgi:hypothetical protein